MTVQLAGIDITLRFEFFAVLLLFLLLDPTGTASLVIACAAVHELGHLIMMRAFGVRIFSIRTGAFGIGIQTAHADTGYGADMLIFAAGPLFNLLFGAAAFFILGESAFLFLLMNMVMAVFNLLPIVPLDGGRLLHSLTHRFLSERTARKLSWWCSFFMLLPVFTGALVLWLRQGNVSLLITCAYLIAVLFFGEGAKRGNWR